MVKTLDSQSLGHVSKTTLWVFERVSGTPGNVVVKSKLSPHSGYAASRQLNRIHKKGAIIFFFNIHFIMSYIAISILLRKCIDILLFNADYPMAFIFVDVKD